MRAITQAACNAFEGGYNMNQSNTNVSNGSMFLHGHEIARWIDGVLEINLQGWNTNTTRERLNGLRGVKLRQKNFVLYLNGSVIESSGWYKVN